MRMLPLLCFGLLAAVACAGDAISVTDMQPDASAAPGKDAGSTAKRDAGRRDASLAARPDAGDDPSECAGIEAAATSRVLPVDIVWAIDSSGSMLPSFPAIREALGRFSTEIAMAGIDAHIVLIASAQMCVPAPLGSGSCGTGGSGGMGGNQLPAGPPASAPDSKEPAFLHLDVPFGNALGMQALLDSHPYYRHVLRAGARTHLVITEDGAPPMSAEAVVEHVEGRASATQSAPWTPGLADGSWVFSGVVCKSPGGLCLLAAFGPAPETTLKLIEQTGGVSADLAEAGSAGADPFAQLLGELASAVIVGSELSCEYEIPASPTGQEFDRDLVNVLYRAPDGERQLVPRATGTCEDAVAWTYDDPEAPTRIVLCDAACERIRQIPNVMFEVKFGCQTTLLL